MKIFMISKGRHVGVLHKIFQFYIECSVIGKLDIFIFLKSNRRNLRRISDSLPWYLRL